MPNVETPETAETQAGAAAAENETAPEQRPAQVEGDGSRPGDNGHSANGKGGPDPFFAQKRVTSKLQKEIEELKGLVTQIVQAQTPQNGRSHASSGAEPTNELFWNSPEQYVNTQVEQRLKNFEIQQAQKEAEEYVLSQEFVNPETDFEELKNISGQYGLDSLFKTNPWKAAEVLVELFKAKKGIGQSSAPKSQARSVQSGPVAPVGKKVWTRREIKAMSLEDFTKNEVDIKAAAKEGRIKD